MTDGRIEPLPPLRWILLTAFLAVLLGLFAWLKSSFYHAQGQLAEERTATLLFVALSAAGIVATAFLVIWSGRISWRLIVLAILACLLAGLLNALAVHNFLTATRGGKDNIF